MIRFLIFLLSAYLLTLFQSAVISQLFPSSLKPDLMLILITHLGVTSSPFAGGILVLFCGFLYDSFSGSPFGLFILIYLCIFFFLKLLSKFLILGETFWSRIILVALSMAFQTLLLILFSATLGILENLLLPAMNWVFPQALLTCAACWPLFRLCKKLEAIPGVEPSQPIA